MIKHLLKLLCLTALCLSQYLTAYQQPLVNLGLTSFFDGLPLPGGPGLVGVEYLAYYHSDKFVDAHGKRLGGVPSPNLDVFASVTQFLYQSDREVFCGGKWGATALIPATITSNVSDNLLGIKDSGGGFGDLLVGAWLQWDPIMCGEQPIFAHRLEFDVSFPTGKNKSPEKAINPGNNVYYINPYWAGTWFYLPPRCSLSWRLHYLWSTENHSTHIQAGDAIHLNYCAEFEVIKRKFYVAAAGYYLKQLRNDRLHGHNMPESKEDLFAIGPAALYAVSQNTVMNLNLYFETYVRNRPEGTKLVFRFLHHF